MANITMDKVVALCRVCPAGTHMREVSIGRVITTERGKGYGKKMVQMATKYAFEFLGAEKVTLGVFDNNPSAYHCYKAAGFKETGEKFNVPLFGDTWTVIEMEMNQNEYESLIHH